MSPRLEGPTAFLEKEGLLLAELEQWRLALDEEGRASIATTKRIRRLERELARKEKALAEAAALLVLKKLDYLQEDEDDDTDEETEPGSSPRSTRRLQPVHGSRPHPASLRAHLVSDGNGRSGPLVERPGPPRAAPPITDRSR